MNLMSGLCASSVGAPRRGGVLLSMSYMGSFRSFTVKVNLCTMCADPLPPSRIDQRMLEHAMLLKLATFTRDRLLQLESAPEPGVQTEPSSE